MLNREDSGKNKIVLLTNLFPNPSDTSRGIFVLQMASRLKELCDLTVICPMPYFPGWKFLKRFRQWYQFSQIPGMYVIEEIPVICPKYPMVPKISGFLHALLLFFPLLKALFTLRKNREIDLVNAHWLYPDGVATSWVCNWLNIPFILTARGCDVNHMAGKPIIGRLIKKAVRSCDRVTTVSAALKTKIESWGLCVAPPLSIPNGVDFDRFRIREKTICRQELGLSEVAEIILFIGRLSTEKGFNWLIEAIDIMVRQGTRNFLVVVIGDGPLRNLYEKRVCSKGLSKYFLFKGNQENDIVSLWLGASSLLCLPSQREGYPNVIMEALAAGRPVVASRVGGVPEMVSDGRQGFLSKSGDPDDLAKCLQRVLAREWDPGVLRDSISNRTWESVARSYCAVYHSVLKPREKH